MRSRHIIDNPDVYVGGGEITGLSCGDAGWCVAVDTRGSVLTQYQTPIGGWHTTEYVDGYGLAAAPVRRSRPLPTVDVGVAQTGRGAPTRRSRVIPPRSS